MTLAWLGAGAVAAVGLIIVAIGLFTPVGAASFGWFAYQPLANAAFLSGGSAFVLSQITAGGFLVLAVGLIALAYLAGRASGRRSRP